MEFLIPELNTFSHHVQNAVTTGIITGKARREIIQVLRTYMTAHTIYLTSEQYKTVCSKLISKYPKLKDTEGKTKYVSNHYYQNVEIIVIKYLEFMETWVANIF